MVSMPLTGRKTSRPTSARGRRTHRDYGWRTRACSARTAPTRPCARASATRDAFLIYGHLGKRPSGAARTSQARGAAWIGRRPSHHHRGHRRSRRSRRRTRRPSIDCPLSPRPFVSLSTDIHTLTLPSPQRGLPRERSSRPVSFSSISRQLKRIQSSRRRNCID